MSEAAAAAAIVEKRDRVFLVVIDDSPERTVALRYACLRARKGGGRVTLLRVVEPPESMEWAGVGALMQAEAREAAERVLADLAPEVAALGAGMPMLIIREGDPRDALLALLAEDPSISILILAAAAGSGGPGPLIAALTGRYATQLRVPMTVVPGGLSDADLERVTW